MITIYGIKNCDTIKRALKALELHGISHVFHDFRKDGLMAADLDTMVKAMGYEALLNTRGTTWRKLDENLKENVTDDTAKAIMLEHVAAIKRPVWKRADGEYKLGFPKKDETAILDWLQSK